MCLKMLRWKAVLIILHFNDLRKRSQLTFFRFPHKKTVEISDADAVTTWQMMTNDDDYPARESNHMSSVLTYARCMKIMVCYSILRLHSLHYNRIFRADQKISIMSISVNFAQTWRDSKETWGVITYFLMRISLQLANHVIQLISIIRQNQLMIQLILNSFPFSPVI